MSVSTPKTLQDAIKHFADYSNAHNFMVGIRWPDGQIKCPTCGGYRVRYIATRRQWECREQHPKRRFSLKTGTIMEDSPLPLEKWLAALWYEVNCKNSISSYEIHRELGVTQKTGWFMLHRIRHALKEGTIEKMGGHGAVVEADETAIGGLSKNMHLGKHRQRIRGSGFSDKTLVAGLLERHSKKNPVSRIHTQVIKSTHKQVLHDIIHKNVEAGSEIHTDALPAYRNMTPDFTHKFIDHAEKYVEGNVHTNGIENFWAIFKRCIKGTHISCDPHHLHAYLDSECFRFNYCDVKNADRFRLGFAGFAGKRLTYKALIGASEGYTQSQFGF